MSRFQASSLSLSLILLAGACTPGTPGQPASGTSYVPKAGETITTTLGVDGKTARQVTYRFIELEPGTMATKQAAPSQSLLLIPEKDEVVDAALAGAVGKTDILPEAEFHALIQEWDELVNGKDDAGFNAKDFVVLLDEVGMDPVDFLQFRKASGLSLAEVRDIVVACRKLDDKHGGQGFDVLDAVLEAGDLTWKDLAAALKGRGQTFADLTTRIAGSQQDLYTIAMAWQAGDKPLVDFLLDPGSFSTQKIPVSVKIDPAKLIGVVLDIAKFGYQVIKDNAPQAKTSGANTSVLHTKVKDPFAYGNAKDFATAEFSWTGKNLLKMTLFDMKFRMKGTYGATSNQVGGHYLPSIYTEFTGNYVMWPWKVNGSAEISQIANMGTIEAPNPQIDITTNLEAHMLLQHMSHAFPVTLQGANGIVRQWSD